MRVPHLRKEMRRRDFQVFHYGMLVLMLAFLAWLIHWYLTLPPGHKGQSYTPILILVMLLSGRLMGAYRWPRRVSVALEILWWSGLALTLCFMFCR